VVITLSKETVHRPVEILFTDQEKQKSLQNMIKTSLSRCSEELRLELTKKMVFCGGCSMIKGMYDRIDKELSSLDYTCKLEFDWQRRYSAWVGGSMIGSLSTFQQLAIKNTDNSPSEIIKRII
jgi:actin beta/gamma 1